MFGTRPGTHPWRTRADPQRKRQWAGQHRPCARCGQPIDYTAPYWHIIAGRHIMNPHAYVEGHIIGLALAAHLGWTKTQANAPSNKQPECARCSRRSGAKEGRALQTGRRLTTSRQW